jgi:hypothetical protein
MGDRVKRLKDRRQGLALLDSVAEAMPHYSLDDCFAAAVPMELRPMWEDWRGARVARAAARRR